jgi:septal ring factor EnvC (AmiA/AmiB activator)
LGPNYTLKRSFTRAYSIAQKNNMPSSATAVPSGDLADDIARLKEELEKLENELAAKKELRAKIEKEKADVIVVEPKDDTTENGENKDPDVFTVNF